MAVIVAIFIFDGWWYERVLAIYGVYIGSRRAKCRQFYGSPQVGSFK